MSRYLVILAALIVGIGLGILMSKLKNKSAAETVLVEEKPPLNLWPWVAGMLTLLVGLYLISDETRAPINAGYNPAIIKDGNLIPGGFDEDKN